MEELLEIEREADNEVKEIDAAIAAGLGPQGSKLGVQGFYSGVVVLITGGSGYMGKHLLEKLFRSCEIRKVYLLLRRKKGMTIEARLNNLLKESIFDKLHEQQPDFKQRVVPIEGDVSLLKLGLSEDNWRDLADIVSVIFHVAATVKFSESLKISTLINVRGTREAILLAKDCRQLKAFVYVSTAYSNVTESRSGQTILEQFYPTAMTPDFLIRLVEDMPADQIEDMTAKLIQGWPNTYSFSKAMAEEVVRTLGWELPACIVRPAIVIGAYREPTPGWLDKRCIHGPSGIGISLLLGVNHVVLAQGAAATDLVPVDLVNNAAIVAAASCAVGDVAIYNVSSDKDFVWAQCIAIFRNKLSQFPSPKIVGDCMAVVTSSILIHTVLTMLLHYVPAGMVDLCCVLVGKKPWLISVYRRLHNMTYMLSYFTLKNWVFSDKNTQKLYHNLSKLDRRIFNFDRNTINAEKMLVLWSIGLRKFILNDGLKGHDVGKRKKILFRLFSVVLLTFYFIVFVWILKVLFRYFL